MMLKFGRVAVVSTAALALTAAIPSKAEASGFFPGGYGAVAYGGGGYYGGCGCQAYVPPPPPPPPPCCVYDGGWDRGGGGYYGGGYYRGAYDGYYGY